MRLSIKLCVYNRVISYLKLKPHKNIFVTWNEWINKTLIEKKNFYAAKGNIFI